MADQTVAMRLVADASEFKKEMQDSGQVADQLAGKVGTAGSEIESSLQGATSATEELSDANRGAAGFWQEHSTAITAAGVAMAGAGTAIEGLARKQQDTRFVASRLANAIEGETTDSIMNLAAEVHDATRDLDEMVQMMETGSQQGLRSAEDLQDYAVFWDTVGDATGESASSLADASSALRAVGVAAGEEGEALAAFGYIAEGTTGSVGEFLKFIERTGPELNDLGASVDDAAAILGILEHEFGMSGRTARQEFRSAIGESDGSMQGLLETLGVTETQFATYTQKVADSSEVIADNAQAFKESRTPLQELQADLEAMMAKFSGVTAAASALSPVLMAGGGVIVGLNQLSQLSPKAASGLSSVARGLGSIAGRAAAYGVAAMAISAIANALSDLTGIGANDLSNLNAELELLARTGRESGGLAEAADGIDGIVRSIDVLTDPSLGQNIGAGVSRGIDTLGQVLTLGMLDIRGTTREMQDELQGVDDALAGMVTSGQAELAAEVFNQIADAAAAAGIPIETVTAALPGYARELELAAARSDDAAGSTGEYDDALDGLEGGIDETRTAQELLTESVNDYLDTVRAATDPVFALTDALVKVEDAQTAYNDAVKKYGKESPEAEAAAMNLARAVRDAEAAAINGELSYDDFKDELARWVAQGAITAEQAEVIKGRVDDAREAAEDYQGGYLATLRADVSQAQGALDGFIEELKRRGFTNKQAVWSARLTAQANTAGLGDGPGRGGGGSARRKVEAAMQGIPGLRITSSYRDPAHNARVGGSPSSYHLDAANPAVDIAGPMGSLDILASRLRNTPHRELIWRAPGHWDHVHYAHTGGEVSSSWPTLPGLQADERPAVLQVGETVIPRNGGGSTVVDNRQFVVHMPPGSDGDDVVRALKQYERRNGSIPVRTG